MKTVFNLEAIAQTVGASEIDGWPGAAIEFAPLFYELTREEQEMRFDQAVVEQRRRFFALINRKARTW